MIEHISRYDFFGPFQVSQNKAFIRHHYVPFDMGSLELREIINSKKKDLTSELTKWGHLEKENERVLNDKP